MSILTPKEKAWKLYNSFATISLRYDKAAEMALICVEEIQEFMKNDDEETDTCFWANHKNTNYWCDVATELHRLKPLH